MKNNITLLLAVVVFTACSTSITETTSALPLWERKSAPAVIQGRYTDWQPGDKIYPPDYWGNNESLKETTFPDATVDSIGGFTLVWDICYPLSHHFHGWSILLCPGDTIQLDINSRALEEFVAYRRTTLDRPACDSINSTLQTLWKKAIHTEGGTLEQPLPIHVVGLETGYDEEFVKAHLHDSFEEWRELCWEELQSVLQQLDSLTLSPAQREYHKLLCEQAYIDKLKGFMFPKTCYDFYFKRDEMKDYVAEHHLVRDSICITDEAELEAFRQQLTLCDPHAADLTFYRSRSGFYVCHEMDYLQANGLDDSPLGQWLKEVEKAKTVMARVKALQPVSESEIDSLAQEFQVQIREVQAQFKQETAGNEGVRRDLPKGSPQEWLPKIVAEHKDHIVFVDFWATWCGPCLMGMKEMESVKDELRARGVDFIYITNTSSNTKEWLKYISQHAGDHYIVPKEKQDDMQIPGYDNGIPHYLIYDREGQLVKAITGWSDVETMMKELKKVK